MTTSTSRRSYQDCFDLMEQAIKSKGVRVQFANEGVAKHFRLRIHKARVIDRDENAAMYPDPNSPMHGISVYDTLVCRVKDIDGKSWLYLEKNSLDEMVIESLGESEEEYEPIPDQTKVLVEAEEPELPMLNDEGRAPIVVEQKVARRI